jgi:hypothetical protein
MTIDEAEKALREWAEMTKRRNEIVLAAYEAGVPLSGINAITGIARTTLYAILRTKREMSPETAKEQD